MPIVVTAKQNDSTQDLIKQFKRATALADVVQIAKDRKFFAKPAKVRAEKKIQMKRLQKRLRSLKRTKNVPAAVIARLTEYIQS
ncbi:30S ribosomal protein S21 [Candidatus Woesebacteria bacterium]|nr:30S ribosomal protein S21 [Candidatus Woesebacteria bacterium]